MDKELKQLVINYLTYLGEGGEPIYPTKGLCPNLNMYLIKHSVNWKERLGVEQILSDTWIHWSEYSGNLEFPVPEKGKTPISAYQDNRHHWFDNEYGKARRRLCLWLAEQLKKEI